MNDKRQYIQKNKNEVSVLIKKLYFLNINNGDKFMFFNKWKYELFEKYTIIEKIIREYGYKLEKISRKREAEEILIRKLIQKSKNQKKKELKNLKGNNKKLRKKIIEKNEYKLQLIKQNRKKLIAMCKEMKSINRIKIYSSIYFHELLKGLFFSLITIGIIFSIMVLFQVFIEKFEPNSMLREIILIIYLIVAGIITPFSLIIIFMELFIKNKNCIRLSIFTDNYWKLFVEKMHILPKIKAIDCLFGLVPIYFLVIIVIFKISIISPLVFLIYSGLIIFIYKWENEKIKIIYLLNIGSFLLNIIILFILMRVKLEISYPMILVAITVSTIFLINGFVTNSKEYREKKNAYRIKKIGMLRKILKKNNITLNKNNLELIIDEINRLNKNYDIKINWKFILPLAFLGGIISQKIRDLSLKKISDKLEVWSLKPNTNEKKEIIDYFLYIIEEKILMRYKGLVYLLVSGISILVVIIFIFGTFFKYFMENIYESKYMNKKDLLELLDLLKDIVLETE